MYDFDIVMFRANIKLNFLFELFINSFIFTYRLQLRSSKRRL